MRLLARGTHGRSRFCRNALRVRYRICIFKVIKILSPQKRVCQLRRPKLFLQECDTLFHAGNAVLHRRILHQIAPHTEVVRRHIVKGKDTFHGNRVVVADLLQRLADIVPVDPGVVEGNTAVRFRDMELADVAFRAPDGCAEVIKYGVLFDPQLLSTLKKDLTDFHRESVIARADRYMFRVKGENSTRVVTDCTGQVKL